VDIVARVVETGMGGTKNVVVRDELPATLAIVSIDFAGDADFINCSWRNDQAECPGLTMTADR
jgi:hypothetical protein